MQCKYYELYSRDFPAESFHVLTLNETKSLYTEEFGVSYVSYAYQGSIDLIKKLQF